MAKRKTKPIVAVVGRPNVGKSTLFNALAGENISIVKDTPGITRDRIYADIHWLDMTFTLIDTGGIEPDSKDVILSQMREQAEIAMETADVIIFLVDVKQGLVDADSKVADMLRRSHKPVVLVVNKVDSFQKYMADVYEFYNLGIGDPHPISAVNRLGIGDMLEAVTEYFDKEQAEEEEDDRTRVAIVGKPNVGKSSLINKLLGENRLIVSDIAGTTRDAVDTEITYNGKEYVFIDTAGLRRKNKIKEELERYMIVRTVSAVERAEVVVLMIDAEEGVTEQDAKIAGIAHERGKATIIVVNKWDAIEKDDKTIYKFTEKVRNTLSFMPYAELLFVSAKTGQRLPKLFETIDIVSENHAMRVATGVLNEIMAEAVAMQQPPSDKGKRLRLYYITKSCDFGNASGDQRSLRIISVAQSVCDTGSQCHYIFQCTAQLNSQYIGAGIDTEHFVHKQILHIFRAAFALRTRYDRCRNPAADFLRVGRSGQHRYLCLRNLIFDDLRLGHQGMLLDSLGDTDNFLSLCHQRADAVCCASGIGACHCHDQQVLALDGLFIIRRKDHILRKLYSRQHLMLVILLKHLNLCGNRRPYRHLMSVFM